MRPFILLLSLALILSAKDIGLVITSDPTGVQIYENDSLLGRTPLTLKDSKMTVHHLKATKDNFFDTTWSSTSGNLDFSKDHILLRADIPEEDRVTDTSSMANLEIQVEQPEVEVFVDGTPYDHTLDKVIELKPGQHFINITGRDIEHYLDTLDVIAGERVRLIAQVQLRDFFSVGAYYVRDFAKFDFEDAEVQLAGVHYTLDHEEDVAGQREFAISMGNFKAKKSSGFLMYIHVPRTDTFHTSADDDSDTLRMITTVWGAGMYRDYFWTLFRVKEYFQFDLGVMWGAYAKVRQYKYYSNSGSGGLGDLNLENRNGESLAPFRLFANIGGPQARILAGYRHIFFSMSYQFQPSFEFDGIHEFPSDMFRFRPIHRLSIGITGKI